ncbi:MAG: hypothetical protein H6734_20020, partial [Alphaproteobacteria bacterium]|nr:hypothetical protein [Alphaproteobacteria bacterium]
MLTLLSAALAADLTRMPDASHAEIGAVYAGSIESGRIVEGDLTVADRRFQQHDMLFTLAFAPVKGLAITAAGDLTAAWSYKYFNARTMLLEPVEGGGSYLGSEEPVDGNTPVVREGSGLNGIWVGAALAPFSEAYAKNHRVTWRVDVGYRSGSARKNRWTVVDGGRGAAPGGSAFRVMGAFSRRTGVSEPYIRASWQAESPVEVDVVDEGGLGGTLALKPASIAEIRGGCELHSSEGDEISVDVWVGARY